MQKVITIEGGKVTKVDLTEETPSVVVPKKDEPKKVEPKKKDEPKKVEPRKVDPPKVDPPKVDPPKVDPPKKGTSRKRSIHPRSTTQKGRRAEKGRSANSTQEGTEARYSSTNPPRKRWWTSCSSWPV